jgi:hypothetical protein
MAKTETLADRLMIFSYAEFAAQKCIRRGPIEGGYRCRARGWRLEKLIDSEIRAIPYDSLDPPKSFPKHVGQQENSPLMPLNIELKIKAGPF